MITRKLIPMVQFVIERAKNAPLEPYHEVNENFVNAVVDYATFLDSELKESMFIGENPIFPNFVKCSPKEAEKRDIQMSFDFFGKNEFMMRIFQKDYKAGDKTYDTFVTYFHLKKVEQLTTFGLIYNESITIKL